MIIVKIRVKTSCKVRLPRFRVLSSIFQISNSELQIPSSEFRLKISDFQLPFNQIKFNEATGRSRRTEVRGTRPTTVPPASQVNYLKSLSDQQ